MRCQLHDKRGLEGKPFHGIRPARPIPERDLELMKRLDRLHLEMPFAGAHMLRNLLAPEGFQIGRKHVSTLMKRMAIEALYRKSRITTKHPQHRAYPYLLRGLSVDRPNQVYAMDITYSDEQLLQAA